MAVFGFSTGALEKSDFRRAIDWIKQGTTDAVEFSALRLDELKPLIDAVNSIDTEEFRYISFHAPSAFRHDQEEHVIELLEAVFNKGWNIVVHPDVIFTPRLWRQFGRQLLVENMDRRKTMGRTASELQRIFENLPDAQLCLDVAHARNLDTTLSVLSEIVHLFRGRIAEIHISELDSQCKHQPLSASSVRDYRKFAEDLQGIPVIIESVLQGRFIGQRTKEVSMAMDSMSLHSARTSTKQNAVP